MGIRWALPVAECERSSRLVRGRHHAIAGFDPLVPPVFVQACLQFGRRIKCVVDRHHSLCRHGFASPRLHRTREFRLQKASRKLWLSGARLPFPRKQFLALGPGRGKIRELSVVQKNCRSPTSRTIRQPLTFYRKITPTPFSIFCRQEMKSDGATAPASDVQGMIDINPVLVMATSTCPFCIEVQT